MHGHGYCFHCDQEQRDLKRERDRLQLELGDRDGRIERLQREARERKDDLEQERSKRSSREEYLTEAMTLLRALFQEGPGVELGNHQEQGEGLLYRLEQDAQWWNA